MRILVAAVSYSSNMSGVQRHALNMVRCLLLNADVTHVHLVLGPWQRQIFETSGLAPDHRLTLHCPDLQRGSIARNRWYYQELPKLVAELQPDLLHLSYPMPIHVAAINCPTVLTLHDLYPYEIPRNFGLHQFFFNRLTLRSCMRNVDAIACVSDATMDRLKHYASSAIYRKATRIYNCVEPDARCLPGSPFPEWHDEPFLLSVAQHRRNKNIPLLIRTFHRMLWAHAIPSSMKLVVIGTEGPETRAIHSLVDRLGLIQRVLFFQGISQSELHWCYVHTAAVVLPSETEGFGLPMVEALMAGCPVVCSDIPAFREIGGDHCTFVDLNADAEISLAAAIQGALDKPRGVPSVFPQLSAHVLADEYATLYRDLIAATGARKIRRASTRLQTERQAR